MLSSALVETAFIFHFGGGDRISELKYEERLFSERSLGAPIHTRFSSLVPFKGRN